jgi:hypothetical protein
MGEAITIEWHSSLTVGRIHLFHVLESGEEGALSVGRGTSWSEILARQTQAELKQVRCNHQVKIQAACILVSGTGQEQNRASSLWP